MDLTVYIWFQVLLFCNVKMISCCFWLGLSFISVTCSLASKIKHFMIRNCEDDILSISIHISTDFSRLLKMPFMSNLGAGGD